MAKVIWEDCALSILLEYIENARLDFGTSAVNHWQKDRKTIEWRLEGHPTSYSPEKLLMNKHVVYRSCLMMSRRFKLIYYYDEAEDLVHIVDIWDTLMNPKTLAKRID